ncbi:hypothetical protein [Spirosoma sp. KUDC1026]|uniref:hypothetical protein n=1 Tax=Spirosoma sp. KUDC1026 TaxID=2745947 RepID=UPI00159B86A9|nr:hypothetical protein [Spirosoma sp. KUDC1026]QKZ14101.1 hypothetical protein HU175_16285 [Spirosoma sp. KUDC1026]
MNRHLTACLTAINGLIHWEDETNELMRDVFTKVRENCSLIQSDRPLAGFLHTSCPTSKVLAGRSFSPYET